jgi:hypothetical protein
MLLMIDFSFLITFKDLSLPAKRPGEAGTRPATRDALRAPSWWGAADVPRE